MRNKVYHLGFALRKVEPRHVRIGLAVLTLVCFVIGAGAPQGSGY
jgi:hypothetical protein